MAKRQDAFNPSNNGLASESEDEMGTYRFFSGSKPVRKQSSKTPRMYDNGKSFQMKHKQITDYHELVPEKSYLIDVGTHLFTGKFKGFDHRGYAIFDDYSELKTYGKTFLSQGKTYIPPLNQQKYRKRYIYEMSLNTKLPENLVRHVKSFMGGYQKTNRMAKKRKTKKYKRK